MNAYLLGEISLNSSLVIYLIQYIPQLRHNRHGGQLAALSLNFHTLLMLSLIADLVYGLGMNMPWQYILVSSVGLLYLTVQHVQLRQLYTQNRLFRILSLMLVFFFIAGGYLVANYPQAGLFIVAGYVAQIAGRIHTIPQIIKNMRFPSALALSAYYLGLSLTCAICDNISAWALGWPMPSKLGAMANLMLSASLIVQRYRTSVSQSFFEVTA